MDILNNISGFFNGENNAKPNPDPSVNAFMLEEAKRKIDIGIFTKFFKKPFLIAFEIISYLIAILMLFAGILFYSEIDSLLGIINTFQVMLEESNDPKPDLSMIWIVKLLSMILSTTPAFICFLTGRLFKNARKRLNTFIQVESIIDRVIFNLQEEKV